MKGIVYVVVGFLLGAMTVSAGSTVFSRWQFWAVLILSSALVLFTNRVADRMR
jgi:uncharacterized membrane protein YoaK (UPF0700 family)